VAVTGVGKVFRIPHERRTSLQERLVHGLRSGPDKDLRALDGVSFEVKRGEFFGIVGRNGSGKSTLLKCIAGIYDPRPGQIAVSGRLSPFIELGVGFKPELTARQNVLINATLLGLSRRQARDRFNSIMAFAELEEFVDVKLKNFSSGMSVRLAFSVAIQVDADVLLVDEVLAVGDSAFQQKCFDQFERLKREGRTVLFVTHGMDAVRRLCDRALLLDEGRVVTSGDPDDVAASYEELNKRQAELAEAAAPGRGAPAITARPAFAGAGAPATYRPSALGDDLRRFVSLTFSLATTEFRLHYEGSVLGFLWSVMRPLMLFAVLYFVFTKVGRFGSSVKDYPVYLLSSIVLWTFFSEAASGSVASLVRHEGVLRRMRFPRLVIPLSVALKSLFNLALNSLAVAIVIVIAGVQPRLSWLELPLLVSVLVVLATGVGMLLSALYIRYRDTAQLWSVVQQVLFFGSPILYVSAAYPEAVRELFSMSPLAAAFTQMRHALIDPSAPTAAQAVGGGAWILVPVALSAALFALGLWFFRRQAPRIVESL